MLAPALHVTDGLLHKRLRKTLPCVAQPCQVLRPCLALGPGELQLPPPHFSVHLLPQRVIADVQIGAALRNLEDLDPHLLLRGDALP